MYVIDSDRHVHNHVHVLANRIVQRLALFVLQFLKHDFLQYM